MKGEETDNKFSGISLRTNNSSMNKIRNSLIDYSREKSMKTFIEKK